MKLSINSIGKGLFILVSMFLLLTVDCIISESEGASANSEHASVVNDNHSITNNLSESNTFGDLDRSVNRFIRKWDIKGAAVAIAKEGKLVYAKGFGYADVEHNQEVQPYNLFRVASVSKLITASAIMKLVEEGRLSLTDTVFGAHAILNQPVFLGYVDPRVEKITVKNLLNHSAGWTTRYGDHMFMGEEIARALNKPMPVSLEDIVAFALSKRLHFEPSNHSSYCNIGYGILQLVIERITGINYEDYVKSAIFAPIGITDAFLAFNLDEMRYANEVKYYEVHDANPIKSFNGADTLLLKSRGGNDIRTLGAAGGWVISPISLMRFLLSVDGDEQYPDILSKQSVAELVTQDKGYHPLGWRWITRDGNYLRTGSFPGTSALAVVRQDGFSYVFLTNTSSWVGPRLPYEVERVISRSISKIDTWPSTDLFKPITRRAYHEPMLTRINPILVGKIPVRTDKIKPLL